MPRSRGSSDAPQRQSPRAPLHLRATACSEANSVHHRPVAADRSPRVSPRGVLQEQRKRGTRVTDLETKLKKAQEELKRLRDQVASAEAAKTEAEQALVKAKKRITATSPTAKGEDVKRHVPQESRKEGGPPQENKSEEESVTSPATMDVFEVVVPTEPIHRENEDVSMQKKEESAVEREKEETKAMISDAVVAETEEKKKEEEEDKREPVVIPDSPQVDALKAKLSEKEKEVEILLEENVIFKTRADEEARQIADAARAKEEELTARLNSTEEELKESRAKAGRLAEQLEAAEGAKAALEAEMKRLRVQTEQWRKAAEAAAAVLATGDATAEDTTGRRVAERCGSMDKHLGWGSPLVAGDMDEDGSGRRKSAGIRVLGELWKKKGQRK
ncbi:interactor of constitutive active ROPs 4-like isoform X1 [Musa acuminata AAA Group]|uniref:interactor of constitutive active ROPs 4-like isoform X1 n=1 Tax=Musa acuminata AAA Group TaxID=214697 RepID=UPI0031D075E2